MTKKGYLVCLTLLKISAQVLGQDSISVVGLRADTYLHPANSNTAYTLQKNEFSLNFAASSLPLPTWAWWGITDKITAEIDFLPLIGGVFEKPHLPVPSFNFRFKLTDQAGSKPALAYETMFQHLYHSFDQADNPYFATRRKGTNWYHHLNASWRVSSAFYMHAAAGLTYAHYLQLVNKETLVQKIYSDHITPDFSLGLDYRFTWISFHANGSYGSTFNYLDNVARKIEGMYGCRLAPFYRSRFKLLKNFRAEWTGFYVSFKDINASAYVPLFIPYVYWQFKWK
ncbi:hypothetical protein AHMF7605_01830 [Adhaeribacter arboris]|uniref:Uncharacterized protein n=1 Tax=Adhaeribacter arboris TaxID=2072846 RepID=A0A2T2YA13_9BACT|nr:hypothetical protein [Adhaeribacter arboris]PSR52349.1 hypothetical protein AHMF7605_01830 [Adhaeribacter arboris]